MIQTYHGLALRLLGRSLGAINGEELPDFSRILDDATALLSGATRSAGVRGDDLRDRILSGFSHILVDEYQDIDEREYAFISALAGRREADEDRKLAIMAVGDDDQSIYGFKGANVAFIRRFQQDYRAREHYLTENYRSTKAIIAAANLLIANNTDRMKVAQPIRVNHARAAGPGGGRWEAIDPVARGRVQRVIVADGLHQAGFVAQEIQRMRELDARSSFSDFAVLARTREDLVAMRAMLEDCRIPIDWRAEDEVKISPFRVREIHAWLDLLEKEKHATWTTAAARELLERLRGGGALNRWWRLLNGIWSEWAGETGDAEVPVALIRDFFAEAIAERHRSHRTADGVVLVTAHRAKGLEFTHVFVADGGWRAPRESAALEEERRVFYVAATRARETLAVMVRKDRRTPFPYEMSGGSVVDRTARPVADPGEGRSAPPLASRRYTIMDPGELYISYAGRFAAGSPVHAAIEATSTGDSVRMVVRGKRIQIETAGGVPIAALSEAGKSAWEPRLAFVRSARVTAMVRRTREQETEAYRERIHVDAWEFPVVEVCWDAGAV
jgi:ATP-dependent DNA helicase RecQ